jgi:hypothetical protein
MKSRLHGHKLSTGISVPALQEEEKYNIEGNSRYG